MAGESAPTRGGDPRRLSAAARIQGALRRSYGSNHLRLAALSLLDIALARRRTTIPRFLALAASSAHAGFLAATAPSERGERELHAWTQAATSVLSTVCSIAELDTKDASRFAYPPQLEDAVRNSQFSVAGTALLGNGGRSQLGRQLLIASPFLLWPKARRVLQSRELYQSHLLSLVVYVALGHQIVSRLRKAAVDIDDRIDLLMHEAERASLRSEEEALRGSVILDTACRLEEIRGLLVVSRADAAARARPEEVRLRKWLHEEGDGPSQEPSNLDFGEARQVDHYLAVWEAVARVFNATMMSLESVAASGPPRLRSLAAVGIATNSFALRELFAAEEPRRGMILVGDLGFLAAAGIAQRPTPPPAGSRGWTSGFVEATSVAASVVPSRRWAATVAISMATVRAATSALNASAQTAAREATYAWAATASSSWIAHRFVSLSTDQVGQMQQLNQKMTAAASEAAADEARRNAQYLVHDSALQVLLWIQKDDLETHQLLEWIDRETPRLHGAASGGEEQPHTWQDGLSELLAGFGGLGLEAVLSGPESTVDLDADQSACVIDIVNEGLANVFKHSNDRAPRLDLQAAGDELMLSLTNECERRTSDEETVAPGTGISSVAARVERLGGETKWSLADSHFRLQCRLPVRTT